jgi:uroporphyrin-III C-methyltransferase
MIGRVYLVGAGPGDPELLTVKGLRILQHADLVLHDDLVPSSILALASPDAQIVNVGKRCGKKSVNQAHINARMVAGARQGLTVVRLKGGDPSIFGRSGEEIEALRQSEVDFEIVPGVTAASAAAAAAGISLTRRDVASSVVFLTGHRAAEQAASETNRAPWTGLSSARDFGGKTVVIYMPGPHYEALEAQLQAAGISGETPCVLVSAAAGGAQRIHTTTVRQLARATPPAAPAILIVGDVTRFASDHVRSLFEIQLSTFGRSDIMRRDRDYGSSAQSHSASRA